MTSPPAGVFVLDTRQGEPTGPELEIECPSLWPGSPVALRYVARSGARREWSVEAQLFSAEAASAGAPRIDVRVLVSASLATGLDALVQSLAERVVDARAWGHLLAKVAQAAGLVTAESPSSVAQVDVLSLLSANDEWLVAPETQRVVRARHYLLLAEYLARARNALPAGQAENVHVLAQAVAALAVREGLSVSDRAGALRADRLAARLDAVSAQLLRGDDPARVLPDLDRVQSTLLQDGPDLHARERFLRGRLLVATNHPEEATGHLAAAAELQPRRAAYVFAAAMHLGSVGQLRRAMQLVEAHRSAVAPEPLSEDLTVLLARLHAGQASELRHGLWELERGIAEQSPDAVRGGLERFASAEGPTAELVSTARQLHQNLLSGELAEHLPALRTFAAAVKVALEERR